MWAKLRQTLHTARALGLLRVGALAGLVGCWLRFGASVYTLAAWAARQYPQQTALHDDQGPMSFAELHQAAEQLAAQLWQGFGLGPGQTMGIFCRNHRQHVVALLAASRCGAEVVLLNTSFSAVQLHAVLEQQKLAVLVYDLELLPYVEPALENLDSPPQRLYSESLPAVSQARPRLPWRRKGGGLVVLTSGSTGLAKPVRRRPEVGALWDTARWLLQSLGAKQGRPTLLTVPLFHGYGMAALGLCLLSGSPLHLQRRPEWAGFVGRITEAKIEVLVAVPTGLHRLLAELEHTPQPTPALQTIVCGSAPLDPSLAQRVLQRFGPVLFNLYGSSEAGLISMALPSDLAQAPSSVGRLFPGVQLRVLDQAAGELPSGIAGALWVQGPLTLGGGAAGFNTGDVGWVGADGRLYLQGRQDEMLICGGENVYPQTLEQTIKARPYVADAAVVGLSDAELGQRIGLLLVLRLGHSLSPQDIAQDLEPLFPKSLRPKQIAVVDSLPYSATGKLQRTGLRMPTG